MSDKDSLLNAGRAYLARWSEWLRQNPDADDSMVAEAMERGDLPPSSAPSKIDATAVEQWESAFPAAHQIYWQIRSAMEEIDGKRNASHHRAAVLAIHDSFRSKGDRQRLGLPATGRELAERLGVSDRSLRKYRASYADLFATTKETIRNAFIDGYYGRVYEALGESASTPEPQHSADRRLFLQVAGDLTEKSEVVQVSSATIKHEVSPLMVSAADEIAGMEEEEIAQYLNNLSIVLGQAAQEPVDSFDFEDDE